MTQLRPRSSAWMSLGAFGLLSVGLANACSSSDVGAPPLPNTSSGAGGVSGGQGGGASGAPVTVQGGSVTGGGGSNPVTQGGTASGGVTATSGASMGGSATAAGTGGVSPAAGTGTGGFEPGDTPPPHTLNVTAAVGEHQHGDAGVDTRPSLSASSWSTLA